MGYVADTTIAAMRGSYNLGIFFRLGTTPPLHLAFSVGDVPAYVPILDDPSTVYTGAGRILDIPPLETLVNGLADKVSFSLAGLDSVAVGLMLDTAPEVLGALVTVGIAPMDARWQPLVPIIGLWTGTADFISEEMKVETDPTKNRVQSLTLATTTGDSSRAFSSLQTYTNATQQALYPDDTFFARVQRYVPTYFVTWPRF